MRIGIETDLDKTINTVANAFVFGDKIKAADVYDKMALQDQLAVDNLIIMKHIALEINRPLIRSNVLRSIFILLMVICIIVMFMVVLS